MDARAHLNTLVGKTIHTIGQGRPNRIVAVDGADVVVATHRSPNGQRIPIAEVQAAMDMLERSGDLLIDKKIVGYHAFIGAVLATLPGTSCPLGLGASDSSAVERPSRDEQRSP